LVIWTRHLTTSRETIIRFFTLFIFYQNFFRDKKYLQNWEILFPKPLIGFLCENFIPDYFLWLFWLFDTKFCGLVDFEKYDFVLKFKRKSQFPLPENYCFQTTRI